MIRFFCIVVLFLTTTVTAQVVGCTDPHSTNYNSNATVNDGSCVYSNMSVAPLTSNVLPEILNETSGLIFWDNVLLTHNDDTDTKIYGLQLEGWQVSTEYAVPNQINTDWEEISQDEDFIYIGDFGNNAAGNRGDLRILKIAKAGFEQQQNVQIISFAYQDQADLESVNSNATDFDCEAFIVSSDYIYLFTKQWTSMETTVYRLPKVEGFHIAVPIASWNVEGLITGATFMEEQKIIALSGYNTLLQPFVYLLYDFEGENFFSGNKRKVNLPLQFHQIEGIATPDGSMYYLSNERFSTPFLTIPARIHVLDLSEIMAPYIGSLYTSEFGSDAVGIIVSFDRERKELVITASAAHDGDIFVLYDQNGKSVLKGKLAGDGMRIDVSSVAKGVYNFQVGANRLENRRILIR